MYESANFDFINKSNDSSELYQTLLAKTLNIKTNSNNVHKDDKIYPDLQLICALECLTLGIKEKNISIHRENTFGHPILFSYREATQHHKDDKQRFCTNFIYS